MVGIALAKAAAIGTTTSLLAAALLKLCLQQTYNALSVAAQAPSLAIPTFLNATLLAVGGLAALWWALSAALIIVSLLRGSSTDAGLKLRGHVLRIVPKACRSLLVTTASAGLVFATLPAHAVEQGRDTLGNQASHQMVPVRLGMASNEAQKTEPTTDVSLTFGAAELAFDAKEEASRDNGATHNLVPLTRPSGLSLKAAPTTSTSTSTEPTIEQQTAGSAQPSSSKTPIQSAAADVAQLPSAGADKETRTVVVRSGDCLWDIAARALPKGSSNLQISEHWQKIYALNLEAVGDDPDLLSPGAVLQMPS